MDPLTIAMIAAPLAMLAIGAKTASNETKKLTKGGYSFYINGLRLKNLTKTADKSIRKYLRDPNVIKGTIIHQTSFDTWKEDNSNWNNINAHFVVLRSGLILVLHDPIIRLRLGTENANEYHINIEHEGNYRSIYGQCYQPEKFGCNNFPTKEQIFASRQLIANLQKSYPNFKEIRTHIQYEDGKSNCAGPQLWYNVGEYMKNVYKLDDGGPGWHNPGGSKIPDEWRDPKFAVPSTWVS